ncbi:MAG: replisome organizer, partial [Aerococcaceae bacterium]|nr:replisome organizer [Aerococcaceae bacterium]
MAERRMFSNRIIDSDDFLDLPDTTKVLYFYLNMKADDDGFISNPRGIMRLLGAKQDDMKLLISKQFIIAFQSGVVVIKDWRIHNYIRNDRKKNTTHLEEQKLISLEDNGSYTLNNDCLPNDNQMTT